LVTRDVDLLQALARHGAVMVAVSVTTLDAELCGVLEPRTSRPYRRLEAIAALAAAGIPTVVMIAPIIPALTDHEIPAILQQAARAGAVGAGKVVLRLPHAVAPLFEQWLEAHAPEKKAKVLSRIRALRGGKLYDASWVTRQTGAGLFADQIEALFSLWCKKAGLASGWPELTTAHFRRPAKNQLGLFEES
jgi:DNA repair photolyase